METDSNCILLGYFKCKLILYDVQKCNGRSIHPSLNGLITLKVFRDLENFDLDSFSDLEQSQGCV